MKKQIATIIENANIAKGIWQMKVRFPEAFEVKAGQFVQISLPGKFLRRPISICDMDDDVMTLVYKVVGSGTEQMTTLTEGDTLDILAPLGNGYDLDKIPDGAVLVGGGVGVPPMYCLAKAIADKKPIVYLGFASEEEIFFKEVFEALGVETHLNIGGYVTDDVPAGKYICACGPEVMLRAANAKAADGQYSFEARMACGFGACMGCSMHTKDGYKRVCKDGPVIGKEDLAW